MSKPLPTYEQYCGEVRKDQAVWDRDHGLGLNYTGVRSGRPGDPTTEAYAKFIYWRGRTDGVDDYREKQKQKAKEEAAWEKRRGEIEAAIGEFDEQDVLRALGYCPEDFY